MGNSLLRRRGLNVSIAVFLLLQILALGIVAQPFIAPADAEAASFANAAFERTWARTDQPVTSGAVQRTWMWGPQANTSAFQEDYANAPGGKRTVQYFDKSRMEDASWTDATDPWDVTNGLLVVEMISGRMQIGNAQFETHEPADVNIAGDPGSHPTYADIDRFGLRQKPASKVPFTTWVDANGIVANGPTPPATVNAAEHVVVGTINHTVASVFWDFMNSTGLVYENGQITQGKLFINPFYATGYPITEAYWSEVKIGGTPQAVLWQCFERRCLTYNPLNDAGWQVEAGNVGQHYYAWRTSFNQTEPEPAPEPTAPPAATVPVQPTAPVTITPTTIVPTRPTAPTDLRASANSASSISLTWNDASSNEKGFRVYNPAGVLVGQVGEGRTTYTVNGLSQSSRYCYQVAAWNDAGESAKTSPACATTRTQSSPAPAVPANLEAEAASATTIKLSWDDMSDNEQGFKIYSSTGSSIGQVGADITTYTVTGLHPATSYCFLVSSWNNAGESAKSSIACATTIIAPPTTPTNLRFFREPGTLEFYLSWDQSGPEPDYYVLHAFSRTGTHNGELPVSMSGSSRLYEIYWPYLDTPCYGLVAINSQGTSDYSNLACWPESITPPAAPLDFFSYPGQLQWAESNGAIGYLVMGLDELEEPGRYLSTLAGSTMDTVFPNSWEHDCYFVRAVNDGGVSDASNQICETMIPTAPTDPTVHVDGPNSITFTWTDNSTDEEVFAIWDGVRRLLLPASPGTGLVSHTFAGLEPGSYWCFAVSALTTAGSSVQTDFACATTDIAEIARLQVRA